MYTKLSIRPQMNVSPQLVMAGKLLHMASHDVEQFISRELADNPALELVNKPGWIKAKLRPGTSDRPLNVKLANVRPNSLSSFDDIIENMAQPRSPLDKLAEQVPILFHTSDQDTALKLLHYLDHRGFLAVPMERLIRELEIPEEKITRLIETLHQFEPPGIGARDIRECFLIQCAYLEAQGVDCRQVRRILTIAWSEFLNQKWERVARKIKEPKEIIEQARAFMRQNFCPAPLAMMETSTETDGILNYADLIILRDQNVNPPGYSLRIPGEEEFELKLSTSFQDMLGSNRQTESALSPQEKSWVKIYVDRASMVIRALHQRWATMRRIGEYIIQCQSGFLDHGPFHLIPFTRAMIAKELNLHESTVSRAVNNKAVQLPTGRLILLSEFFDASLPAKETIRVFLKNSPTRLCDREIATLLREKGINISRRTVTKYRRDIHTKSSHIQSIAM